MKCPILIKEKRTSYSENAETYQDYDVNPVLEKKIENTIAVRSFSKKFLKQPLCLI